MTGYMVDGGEQAARCPVRVAAVGLELDKLSEGDPLRHPMCFRIQGRYLLILAICQSDIRHWLCSGFSHLVNTE